jgi:tRNA(Ile)-lysidine synthase
LRRSAVETAVRRALQSAPAVSAGQTVVAALSGGADSVAQLDALATLARERGFRVVAAHLDHALRPSSRQDAAFCSRLCRGLGVDLRVRRANVRARARRDGGGLEEAARLERYAFLRAVKEDVGAVAIAVAHTRDDQAETVLMRLLRGAGRAGLGGMRARRADLLRPLLGVRRRDVLAHLRARGLAWRDDPSNADLTILRNRVRHELIPYLESRFNPAVREALSRTAELLAEESELVEAPAAALWARCARHEGDAVLLEHGSLRAAPRAVARLVVRRALEESGGLRGVAAVHVEKLLDLAAARAPSGRRLALPSGREAAFRFDEVRIGPRRTAAAPFALPLPVPGSVRLPGGLTVEARVARRPAAPGPGAVVVAAPEGELTVRTRRPGDRVRVAGREISLKRFLMQRRVPAEDRAGLPLVAAGHRVLWVAGQEPAPGPEEEARFVRIKLRKAPPAGAVVERRG